MRNLLIVVEVNGNERRRIPEDVQRGDYRGKIFEMATLFFLQHLNFT
jgi:hypothetical protein